MNNPLEWFAGLVIQTGGLALLVAYGLLPIIPFYFLLKAAIRQYKKHRRRQWAREILNHPLYSKDELYSSIAKDALIY